MGKPIQKLTVLFIIALIAGCGLATQIYEANSQLEGNAISLSEVPAHSVRLFISWGQLVSIDDIPAAKLARIGRIYILPSGPHSIKIKDVLIRSFWGLLLPMLRAEGEAEITAVLEADESYSAFLECRHVNFTSTRCECAPISVFRGLENNYPNSTDNLVSGTAILGRRAIRKICDASDCHEELEHVEEYCENSLSR